MNGINFNYTYDTFSTVEMNKFIGSIEDNKYSYSTRLEFKDIRHISALDFIKYIEDNFASHFSSDEFIKREGEDNFTYIKNKELYFNIIRSSNKSLTITIYSSTKSQLNFIKDILFEELKEYYDETKVYGDWCYETKNGLDYLRLEVKENKHFVSEMYPFINNVYEYFEAFKNSKENILILIGEPGLGKTAFIRELMIRNKWSAKFTYDDRVMSSDQFYISFIKEWNYKLAVLEDADLMLQGRLESDNKIMSKLLNSADGLVSLEKKFIFTANINNVRDIDSALIRPGRCFDVLNFRPLNYNEAVIASAKIGKTLPTKKLKDEKYTVAELYNSDNKSDRSNVLPLVRTGFIS